MQIAISSDRLWNASSNARVATFPRIRLKLDAERITGYAKY